MAPSGGLVLGGFLGYMRPCAQLLVTVTGGLNALAVCKENFVQLGLYKCHEVEIVIIKVHMQPFRYFVVV